MFFRNNRFSGNVGCKAGSSAADTYLGECYVHRYMQSEGIELWKEGNLKHEWADLQ